MDLGNTYFIICSIFIILFAFSKTEDQSNITSSSTSNEINSISASTEIQCDTNVRLHKLTFNWNVNNFDLHRPEGSDHNSIISPTISSAAYDKVKWYLKILPGNQTSDEISLHVCFSSESKETKARAKFTAAFLDDEKNLIIGYGDDTFYAFDNHDEFWGWDRIQVDEVVLPDDKLKISCNITFCETTNNKVFHRKCTNEEV